MANKKEGASAAQTGAENAKVLAESSAENATINTETGAENVQADTADTVKPPEEQIAEEASEQETKPVVAEISVEVPEEQIAQMKAEILEQVKAEFAQNLEAAAKENAELKEKLAAVEKLVEEKDKQLEAAAKTSGSNAFYVDLLNKLEEKFNNYSGIRRERLRSEFITDIKEEIQRQKEQLTNA